MRVVRSINRTLVIEISLFTPYPKFFLTKEGIIYTTFVSGVECVLLMVGLLGFSNLNPTTADG